MSPRLFKILLLMILSIPAKADLVEPGEIKKQFMFTNLDKFPGFTYYYIHHGYHYNLGWHADEPDTSLVKNNQRYTVGQKGNSKTPLIALAMANSNIKYFISDLELGGNAMVDPEITGMVEVYTIQHIENYTITVKKQNEIMQFRNGREEERKVGNSALSLFHNDIYTNALILVSTFSLCVMLLIFFIRKRKPISVPVTC